MVFLSVVFACLLPVALAALPWTGPETLPKWVTPKFKDVTIPAGIRQPGPKHKWGGPCVADVDNDGYYDLILSYHSDSRVQLYYGNAKGTFTRDTSFDHTVWDVHGIHVGPISARERKRLMVVSVGGKRGVALMAPSVYEVSPNREIRDITYKEGFGKGRGRGRTSQFMDLTLRNNTAKRRNGGGPDLMIFNYLGEKGGAPGLRQFSYQNKRGKYSLRGVPGISRVNRGRIEVTDINGDGVMEIVNIRLLRMFQLRKPFEFQEITGRVFPDLNVGEYTISAVAELDYDNDGDFDLYIARTDRTLITNRIPLRNGNTNDLLLENVGGRYIDVTEKARIPKGTLSQGVTVGDFNNDGFVDVLVPQYNQWDLLLQNQGDGTFKRVNNLISKRKETIGNHAVAFDYDLDGRLDVMVGHGGRESRRGLYKLMRNVMKRWNNHYILVRVGNEPSYGVTALHAVVTVYLGKMKLSRRVGSRGAQGGGGSYLETVHFGLGRISTIPRIKVTWSNGVVRWRIAVQSDQKVEFGKF